MSSIASSPGGSQKTLLVIDDDVHLAAIFAMGLEANGYRVFCATNAVMGWEMAHAHLPDLILCDIEMPGKDGRRLLQEMRSDSLLGNCQFVLMTGRAAFANQRAAMDLGADDFLLKPVTQPALLRCVDARLRRAELSRHVVDRAVHQLRGSLGPALTEKLFLPLASIIGLAELLEAELDTQSKEEMRQDLHGIQMAGRRLHRALRNYLLILNVDTRGFGAPARSLDADTVKTALAGAITAAAKSHARADDVAFDFTGASIRADPADLGIVAEELVDNALRFSRKGTSVRVRGWPEGATFCLTVTDTGRGLTPEELERVRSLRQNELGVPVPQGLGLGLTVVNRLATRLGGEFAVESEAGKGTTCRITLPAVTN